MYFKTTASAAPRTATRLIPATSTGDPTNQPKSKSRTGAIVGGVVGGVVGLAAILALVFFCLRHRRRKQAQPNQAGPNRAELENSSAIDPHNPAMSQKAGANYSVHGSSMHSPIAEAPAYSPQSSVPPHSSWNGEQNNYYELSPSSQNTGEWSQQGAYGQPQPYYPPPAELSQHKHQNPQDVRVELPAARTPAISELPPLHSPIPKRA